MSQPTLPTLIVKHKGHDLSSIILDSWDAPGVRRSEVDAGDVLVVRTRNSVYTVRSVGDNKFAVSGGWFRQTPGGSRSISIVGCTLGGTAIRHDLIAACGMHIEFAPRITTSRIMSVCHFRLANLN